jgi:hypothetical protein
MRGASHGIDSPNSRPVLPWRLVAGGFLHFVLPAYLVALVVDLLLFAHAATFEAMLRQALPFSGRFLLVYGAVTLAGSVVAAALDPLLRARRGRREARDPGAAARHSEARLVDAIGQGRGRFGGDADAVLQAIRSGRWQHDDPRFQALSRDLVEVVRTSLAALASTDRERRAGVVETAERALRGIASGLRELELEASRRDEGDAQTVARYVESRYGSDFAGSGN